MKADAVEEYLRESLKYPELTRDKLVVIKEELLAKVATPARLRLVKLVRERKPKSVGELAALAKRPLESVSRDLRILCFYGLLDLVREGKQKKPVLEKQLLVVPLGKRGA